jgi:hypothetical protein
MGLRLLGIYISGKDSEDFWTTDNRMLTLRLGQKVLTTDKQDELGFL